jgi:hypothetical protein
MFLLILLLFVQQIQRINTVECMNLVSTSTLALLERQPCTVNLGFSDAFPSNQQLIDGQNCHNVYHYLQVLQKHLGKCQASVSINYSENTYEMQSLLAVPGIKNIFHSFFFGSKSEEEVLVHYVIQGTAENECEMTVTIICNTDDDCALNEIRRMLPELLKKSDRTKIFEQIFALLNAEGPDSAANLM